MVELTQFCFVDLEASGLASASYPTEVGWALIDKRSVLAGSVLIAPPTEWRERPGSWSTEAETMTGISLAMLAEQGLPPAEAFAHFRAAVGERLLVSDAPEFDGPWLTQLASAALAAVTLRFVDLDAVLNEVAWKHRKARLDRLEAVLAAERLVKKRHRAEDDAIRHALSVGFLADQLSIDSLSICSTKDADSRQIGLAN